MAIVVIEIDTVCITPDDLKQCIASGVVLQATAIFNRRWEDYSAADLVEQCGLPDVTIEAVEDDTAGSLILTVNYADIAPELLEKRLENQSGIASYEICNPLFMHYYA